MNLQKYPRRDLEDMLREERLKNKELEKNKDKRIAELKDTLIYAYNMLPRSSLDNIAWGNSVKELLNKDKGE